MIRSARAHWTCTRFIIQYYNFPQYLPIICIVVKIRADYFFTALGRIIESTRYCTRRSRPAARFYVLTGRPTSNWPPVIRRRPSRTISICERRRPRRLARPRKTQSTELSRADSNSIASRVGGFLIEWWNRAVGHLLWPGRGAFTFFPFSLPASIVQYKWILELSSFINKIVFIFFITYRDLVGLPKLS